MEGSNGAYFTEDYADTELIALRTQEERIRNTKDAERRREQCEREKEMRRKNIRDLGAKPVA